MAGRPTLMQLQLNQIIKLNKQHYITFRCLLTTVMDLGGTIVSSILNMFRPQLMSNDFIITI